MVFGSLMGAPVLAQAAAPAAAATKPATQQDLDVYSQMGAINICVLNSNKVGLDKSLPAATDMVASVLMGFHGGVIQGANNNQKLNNNQLANGAIINLAARVQVLCLDKLSEVDKKTITDILAQAQKQFAGQGSGAASGGSAAPAPAPAAGAKPTGSSGK